AAGSVASPNAKPGPGGFSIETVSSWGGFADMNPVPPPGTRKPTPEWPIPKYLWSDFMVNPGDQVAHRVTPRLGRQGTLRAHQHNAPPWSDVFTIAAEPPGNISCYFNRGIVASQWLARLLPQADRGRALTDAIADPDSKIRKFLAGELRDKLLDLLKETSDGGGHVFAALFELDDPELIPHLQAFGKRAHILLGNGSVKHKGDDENHVARDDLKVCEVHNRMTAPRALAHNKFLVICDSHMTPQAVWTGSTNWTKSGLCTQSNNAVLARNPALAQDYLQQWHTLADSGDASP